MWLGNVEIRCSLQKVLERLKEYITQQHCPVFPAPLIEEAVLAGRQRDRQTGRETSR